MAFANEDSLIPFCYIMIKHKLKLVSFFEVKKELLNMNVPNEYTDSFE